MPSVADNKRVWDGEYAWKAQGDEWSAPWGGTVMLWYSAILPRIHRFLPAGRILEIAPGYGRWTQYLLQRCDRLSAVDLSAECIAACRERFGGSVDLYVNDGSSLAMVAGTFDFVFSFDSLVHVEGEVLAAYLCQLPEKLTQDGAAFIHHSNAGEFASYYRLLERAPRRGKDRLINMGVLDGLEPHWRARSVSAAKVQGMIAEAGLSCISQELVNWRTTRREIDCFTVVTRPGSKWDRQTQVIRNPYFVREMNYWRNLARVYG